MPRLEVGDEIRLTDKAGLYLGKESAGNTVVITEITHREPSNPLVTYEGVLYVGGWARDTIDSHWVEKAEKTLDMSQIN